MTAPRPAAGVPHQLAADLTRVIAPNPSPMTYWGTNSYLVGHDSVAVVDPGPDIPSHRDALIAAVGDRKVTHIIVTHSHVDHSPLARPLGDLLQAPVVAFGPSDSGRSAIMQELAETGLAGGGEGVDATFAPDVRVSDQDVLAAGDVKLRVLHTPGHMGNHIALGWGTSVLTGDLVMGWASSLVSPPDGDLTDFLASCRALRGLEAKMFHPGHGDPITDPAARLDWLIGHRETRTQQIEKALESGSRTIDDLVGAMYADVPAQMHPAAARNVFAHLVHLHQLGRIRATPTLTPTARFSLT